VVRPGQKRSSKSDRLDQRDRVAAESSYPGYAGAGGAAGLRRTRATNGKRNRTCQRIRRSLDRPPLIAGSRKPAVYVAIDWVEAGGLMSYSDDRGDWPRRLAAVADRILRGAKPSELPVEEPARFVLGINQKTARALALTIPSSVLLQASKVIE
jgi:hypothetical protein